MFVNLLALRFAKFWTVSCVSSAAMVRSRKKARRFSLHRWPHYNPSNIAHWPL